MSGSGPPRALGLLTRRSSSSRRLALGEPRDSLIELGEASEKGGPLPYTFSGHERSPALSRPKSRPRRRAAAGFAAPRRSAVCVLASGGLDSAVLFGAGVREAPAGRPGLHRGGAGLGKAEGGRPGGPGPRTGGADQAARPVPATHQRPDHPSRSWPAAWVDPVVQRAAPWPALRGLRQVWREGEGVPAGRRSRPDDVRRPAVPRLTERVMPPELSPPASSSGVTRSSRLRHLALTLPTHALPGAAPAPAGRGL